MGFIADRVNSWMTYEPVIGLLMIVTAIVLFISIYQKHSQSDNAWIWVRGVIESGLVVILFLGLLWGFRALLNANNANFQQSHGRVSSVNYESVKKIWGSPHTQRELQVSHYIEKRVQEEIPQSDPTKPPIYKTVTKTEEIPQNSILGSRGEAKLELSKRKKGSAYYNGFIADFSMLYTIQNDSELETDAHFNFPLSTGQLIYDPFEVRVNGENISRHLRFAYDRVTWQQKMQPGEKIEVKVNYKTRGLEYFYYQIPNPREIRNFSFRVVVDGLDISDLNYPEGCLPPKAENIRRTKDGRGTVLQWDFDKTITMAGMGIALPKPTQPGSQASEVLRDAPYALMMLVLLVCLTFIIQSKPVNILQISFLSANYYLLYLFLSTANDLSIGFWGALALGVMVSLFMSYQLFKTTDKTTRKLILSLVAFYTLVYPLSSLFPDYQNQFAGTVSILIVIYLFSVCWYYRLSKAEQ